MNFHQDISSTVLKFSDICISIF